MNRKVGRPVVCRASVRRAGTSAKPMSGLFHQAYMGLAATMWVLMGA